MRIFALLALVIELLLHLSLPNKEVSMFLSLRSEIFLLLAALNRVCSYSSRKSSIRCGSLSTSDFTCRTVAQHCPNDSALLLAQVSSSPPLDATPTFQFGL